MIVVIMPTLKAEMILLGATSSVESYCLQMNARCTISEKKLFLKEFHVLKKPWIGPISKKQHVNVGQASQLLWKRVTFHFDIFHFLRKKRIKRLTWRRAVTWVRRILGIAGMSSLVENLSINWPILSKKFRKYLLYLRKEKRLQTAKFK